MDERHSFRNRRSGNGTVFLLKVPRQGKRRSRKERIKKGADSKVFWIFIAMMKLLFYR